jgi:hypothetical protein
MQIAGGCMPRRTEKGMRLVGPVALAKKRSRGRFAGWVRKNVVVDQRKLDAARRALGVETETETIDVALGLVVLRRDLVRGIAAVRRAGGVEDVCEKRPGYKPEQE